MDLLSIPQASANRKLIGLAWSFNPAGQRLVTHQLQRATASPVCFLAHNFVVERVALDGFAAGFLDNAADVGRA